MKIYVAAKLEKKELVLDAYNKLKELGHEVSYDWTVHKPIKPYAENAQTANIYSGNELKGIADCDAFIFFSEDTGHTLHMEFGASLILNFKHGKPLIFAVGHHNDKSPWFFNERVKRVETFDDVIKELERKQELLQKK